MYATKYRQFVNGVSETAKQGIINYLDALANKKDYYLSYPNATVEGEIKFILEKSLEQNSKNYKVKVKVILWPILGADGDSVWIMADFDVDTDPDQYFINFLRFFNYLIHKVKGFSTSNMVYENEAVLPLQRLIVIRSAEDLEIVFEEYDKLVELHSKMRLFSD